MKSGITLNDILHKKQKGFGKKRALLNDRDLKAYIAYRGNHKTYGVAQEYLFRDFEEYRKNKNNKPIVLDLGTYNRRFYDGSINIDIQQNGDTDLVWDITKPLPIKTGTVDFVVCSAVLEHVNAPEFVVDEIFRVLKVGGAAWVDIPFMQPYHESPDDYQRYTLSGIKHLFRKFYILKCGPIPGNGFVTSWILEEFRKILDYEKIDISNYPELRKLLSKEYLEQLAKESDSLDKEIVKKYSNEGMSESFHRTASGNFVYAEKR